MAEYIESPSKSIYDVAVDKWAEANPIKTKNKFGILDIIRGNQFSNYGPNYPGAYEKADRYIVREPVIDAQHRIPKFTNHGITAQDVVDYDFMNNHMFPVGDGTESLRMSMNVPLTQSDRDYLLNAYGSDLYRNNEAYKRNYDIRTGIQHEYQKYAQDFDNWILTKDGLRSLYYYMKDNYNEELDEKSLRSIANAMINVAQNGNGSNNFTGYAKKGCLVKRRKV